MKFSTLILTLISICTLISCGSNADSEHQSKLTLKQDLTVDWSAIEANDNYRIYYIPLNYDPFYNNETDGKHITDFMYKDSLYELDAEDYFAFTTFVADSLNFTDGECGTFALNAGFIITEFEVIRGYVDLSCGFIDWTFYPFNRCSGGGNVSDQGFVKMTEMLDAINTKR